MRVGYLQFCPLFGEKEKNLAKVGEMLQPCDGDLLVLPELFSTGYLFASRQELSTLAEPVPDGMTTKGLLEIAAGCSVHIVAGIAERAQEGFYNSAVIVSPDGTFRVYRKAHLFREEKSHFRQGDTPFEVHHVGRTKVGTIICFDWIYPEAIRVLALKGAHIICQPANLILPYCQDAMVTRAIENRVFIITANRTGEESRGGRRLEFTGRSQIVSPKGDVLIRAGQEEETVTAVEIDPEEASDKAATDMNDLFHDRRVDLYGDICRQQRFSVPKKGGA